MSNVVDFKDFKKKFKESKDDEAKKPEGVSEEEFKEIMERNRKNKERVEKERTKANDGVKRSYQLKPNDPNNKR